MMVESVSIPLQMGWAHSHVLGKNQSQFNIIAGATKDVTEPASSVLKRVHYGIRAAGCIANHAWDDPNGPTNFNNDL
jgi:hypothetical protein